MAGWRKYRKPSARIASAAYSMRLRSRRGTSIRRAKANSSVRAYRRYHRKGKSNFARLTEDPPYAQRALLKSVLREMFIKTQHARAKRGLQSMKSALSKVKRVYRRPSAAALRDDMFNR